MAFGINLGIVLLCSIVTEHLTSPWAPQDAQRLRGFRYSGSSQMEDEQSQPGGGYPQDQIRPASSTSGSVQSDTFLRVNGPNTHNQRLSLRGSIQPAPRMLGLSGSGTSVSHNKRHTLASGTLGPSVTNPSPVKPVSSWEGKGIQAKTFHPLQPRSSSSGYVQNFQRSHLFKSNPQNSVAQSGSYQSVRESTYTPDLQALSRASSKTSFRPGSNEGGSSTRRYMPSFSQYVKPYQNRYASASSDSISSQYAQTSDQRIDGTSRSSSIPMSSLASISSLFSPSSTRSGNSYGAYKTSSNPGATLSQSLFTSNQGGSGLTYSQNVLAANQKPSSTIPAQSNHRQVSGQMGRYQPSYVASSGPISSLFSSSQAGSSSTYIQKLSDSKPAPGQPRQSHQSSNTPNAVKSISSYAGGPTQSLFFSRYGPTQSGTTGGTTTQSFTPVSIHNIPERYGGVSIRRLKGPVHSASSPSHSKTSSSSVNKPQPNYTAPAKQKGPSTTYVQVPRSSRWEPRT